MPTLNIDNQNVTVAPGSTILDAARALGLDIPALCHLAGCEANTSCLACVVKVNGSPRLVPACATLAADGLRVESETAEVRAARKAALELLLSDHLGDCVGPCEAVCPAGMEIPGMLRQIAAGEPCRALAIVKNRLALPAILGRVCPAPCEKACRRGQYDSPIAIRTLHGDLAEENNTAPDKFLPARKPLRNKAVAIIGAGPAGLSAAYYLQLEGLACTIFDDQQQPGGKLRSQIPADRLPPEVIDAEVAVIKELGAVFRMGSRLGQNLTWAELQKNFSAVILAFGATDPSFSASLGLKTTANGLAADPATFLTSLPGVFAVGDCLRKQSKLAVRSVGEGRRAARAVTRWLGRPAQDSSSEFNNLGQDAQATHELFNCRIGKLLDGEINEFVKTGGRLQVTGYSSENDSSLQPPACHGEVSSRSRASSLQPASESKIQNPQSKIEDAARCLHCDCRKPVDCKLRYYADLYQASQTRYPAGRRSFVQFQHPEILYEPGKCIACGLCLQIAQQQQEKLGLTFIGRGFDVRVGVPLDRPLAEALTRAARACAAACPTGAISKS